MPAVIVSLATSAQLMRFSRTMMLDVLRQDYIRTAWSKGLRERAIVTQHALRNAMLPVITVLGLTMAALIGGTVIFETIFVIPGLGRHLVLAVAQKDFAVVQGVTLFFAIAVITVNLLVDISYTVLDHGQGHKRWQRQPHNSRWPCHSKPILARSAQGLFEDARADQANGLISLLILTFMLIVAIVPQLFATHDPATAGVAPRLQNFCLGPKDTFMCPTKVETSALLGDRVVPGSYSQPLGTDQLQRDVYSRLVYGARWALLVGLMAVTISSLISLTIGVTCGYFGGRYDAVVQRLASGNGPAGAVMLRALPQMIGNGPSMGRAIR